MQVQGKLKNLFKKISLLLPFLLCFLLALKEFKLFSWQQTQRIYYPLIGIIILWAFIVIVFLAFKFARIKWGKERKWLLLLFLLWLWDLSCHLHLIRSFMQIFCGIHWIKIYLLNRIESLLPKQFSHCFFLLALTIAISVTFYWSLFFTVLIYCYLVFQPI